MANLNGRILNAKEKKAEPKKKANQTTLNVKTTLNINY